MRRQAPTRKTEHYRWQVFLACCLLFASLLVYIFHYALFRDRHNIFFYGVLDIAFLPVQVLLVTMIIHKLLGERERRMRLAKLNMVIGAFHSEVGISLLARFSNSDPDVDQVRGQLLVTDGWTAREFVKVTARLRRYDYSVVIDRLNLEELNSFLREKRYFLLRLLENPNLLEHEAFTELLQAVFHLTEELEHREELAGLPQSDYLHIAGDVKRVYGLLVIEWLAYLEHLKQAYPYLFSLAVRTNPFDRNASVIVR